MFLGVEGLCKGFEGREVLRDVSFDVEAGEFVSLIGPSGVGKTTLLMILAGLETPDAGVVRFAEPPSRERPAIMVFQDYILFPNMTVYENTAFGLRARRLGRRETAARVEEILSYFQLSDKKRHFPHQLSAGQKQRVAIARAMVVNPAMLLLDEPFANLDPNLKLATAEFIRATQREFGITTIGVTHDLTEAFVMSDRVGVMLEGRLVQYDTAAAVYHAPATPEVASFMGPVNVFDAGLCWRLGLAERREDCATLYARPEAVHIAADPQGAGVVESVNFAGHFFQYRVGVDDAASPALVIYSLQDGFMPGDRVAIQVRRYLTSNHEETTS